MKKIVALILAVLMCVGVLAACGESGGSDNGGNTVSVTIIGKWQYDMDVSNVMKAQEGMEQLAGIFEGITIPVVIEFKEDNTATGSVDKDSAAAASEKLAKAVADNLSTVFEAMGLSADLVDTYLAANGMTKEQFAQSIAGNFNLESMAGNTSTLKYRLEGNKLYLEPEEKDSDDDTACLTIELSSSQLKVTEVAQGNEITNSVINSSLLPMVFTRIA